MATGRYHWSNCAYPARFFKINATASLPWLGVVLHPSLTTFYVALVVTAILLYIEIVKKMTVTAFVRAINIWLTGRVKSTRNLIKEITR
jgi:general stress protein CsbA